MGKTHGLEPAINRAEQAEIYVLQLYSSSIETVLHFRTAANIFHHTQYYHICWL